jgi:hypothetical protein
VKRRQPESAISEAPLNALKKLVDVHEIFNAGKVEIDWSAAERLADLEPANEK